MQFAHPKILWLFVVLVPLIVLYILRQRNAHPAMSVSSAMPFARMPWSFRAALRHVVFALLLGALGCMIIVLARPQTHNATSKTNVEGTDIMIALDVSSSMLADDFEPSRLEVAKEVATNFVKGRQNDNIGLVIFSGETLTGVPMTISHGAIIDYIAAIRPKMLADGTQIGDGIANSVNELLGGKAKSKSIILLTDGSNTGGIVYPITAAEIAADNNIKIYTIAIGSNTTASIPIVDYFGRVVSYQPIKVEINTEELEKIAEITGGRAFRAYDSTDLKEVFAEIDKLETTVLDVSEFVHTRDDYEPWAIAALMLVVLALGMRYTLLRTIP